MNRNLIALLTLTTLTFSTWAQETKQIKNKDKYGDLEIFHVLKSDKTIKHGEYEKYFKVSNPMTKGKLLIERGQYVNNKRNGIWTFYWGESNIISKGPYENDQRNGNWEYYENGTVIERGNFKNDKRDGLWIYIEKENGIFEKGNYEEGNKIGIWTYQYFNIPVQTYDHTKDSVLEYLDDKSESEVMLGASNEVTKVVLQRPPQYVGHKRSMQRDMSILTEYPIEARRLMFDGQVHLSFFVNEDGTTGNFTIIKDICETCGQAVIDAYKANTTKWIPGLYNGKKVKVKYYQTVSFKLTIDIISGLGQSEIVYE